MTNHPPPEDFRGRNKFFRAVDMSEFMDITTEGEAPLYQAQAGLLNAYCKAYQIDGQQTYEFQRQGERIFQAALKQVKDLAEKVGRVP
jgi:phage terminase small subunit